MPAQERDRQPTVLRVSDLSSIVVAVEHMLGFRPSESLVAVALCGPRDRMTFSLRLDLPPCDNDSAMAAIAEEVARRMAGARADGVLLFVHSAPPGSDGRLPHRALVEDVMSALAAPTAEAALVAGDRLWSYVCDDLSCCPREGRPIDRQSPTAVTLAAEHAALGNVVLASRDEVVASIRPIGGIVALSMQQAQDRALEVRIDDPVAFSQVAEDEIAGLTDRFTDPRATLTHDEAARIVIALHDKLLRDRMLVLLSDPDEEALSRLLTAVARLAQPPDDAPVSTCVGYAAYVEGSGLLASVAFERALDSDPHYVLAHYLLTMLQGQVSPEDVRSCGLGIAGEVRRRLRSRRRR